MPPVSWLLSPVSWRCGFRGIVRLLGRAEIDLAALVGVEEIAETDVNVLEENALEFKGLTGVRIQNAALEQAGRGGDGKFERRIIRDEAMGGKIQIERIGPEPGKSGAVEDGMAVIPGEELCAMSGRSVG